MAVFVEKTGRRVKKSSPSPLWRHCLPVTALALSARGLDNNLFDSYCSTSYETANKRMERNVATIVWKRRFTPRECDFADMVVHNCRIAVEGNGTNALQLGALLFALLSSQVSALWCHPTSAAECRSSAVANRATCKTASPRSKCQRPVFS